MDLRYINQQKINLTQLINRRRFLQRVKQVFADPAELAIAQAKVQAELDDNAAMLQAMLPVAKIVFPDATDVQDVMSRIPSQPIPFP